MVTIMVMIMLMVIYDDHNDDSNVCDDGRIMYKF